MATSVKRNEDIKYNTNNQSKARDAQIERDIQRHKDARLAYVVDLSERNTLLSMIEGLQAERSGIVEEIELGVSK